MAVIVEPSHTFILIHPGLKTRSYLSSLSVAAVAGEETEHEKKHDRPNYYPNQEPSLLIVRRAG